jgi:hypothetical protein
MDLDLLGAQSAAMAASGESCRDSGHVFSSLFDPEQTSAPCWISMSRTQQLFDVCRTPQVRQ